MTFFLITYKQHLGHKHLDEAAIVEGEDGSELMKRMQELNRTELKSTTEYAYFNLDVLCEESNLKLITTKEDENSEDEKDVVPEIKTNKEG